MDDVKVAIEELREDSESGQLVTVPRRPAGRRWLIPTFVAAALMTATGSFFVLGHRNQQPGALSLRQLTGGASTTFMPALSPDGKLLAYVSDEGTDGSLDIWVQPLTDGASPVRLTQDPFNHNSPSFSPDGSHLHLIPIGTARRFMLSPPSAVTRA